jgi:hypothetical protein
MPRRAGIISLALSMGKLPQQLLDDVNAGGR